MYLPVTNVRANRAHAGGKEEYKNMNGWIRNGGCACGWVWGVVMMMVVGEHEWIWMIVDC